MNNKEAIKYLIPPTSTSTEPSAEYLKQKEAYELAIRSLENERPKGEWVKDYAHEEHGEAPTICSNCSYSVWDKSNFCPNCGADMRGNAK